ncbi:MAG: NAD(P)/FAD-dependent oxidoreductase, partial [Mycobacterium sp.]
WSLEDIALRPPERYQALDAEWRLGVRAESLHLGERRLELDDGSYLDFDGLVVATGAAPRSLPGQPVELPGLHTLRTIEDSLALSSELEDPGARVVVVGAGFIGSEVAATARGRGADVTVVETLASPLLGVLGQQMGETCGRLHMDHGVSLRTGVGVEAIEGDRRVEAVRLADGSVLPADIVVVGVGVSPSTDWLEGSGLEIANGVVCDARLFAAEGVVAAGDVARWHHRRLGEDLRVEHWTNATEQGTVAGHNLLVGRGAGEDYTPVPFFWSDQYGIKIQYVGHSRPDDQVVVVHGSMKERRFVAIYGRDGRLTGALGFSRPRQLMTYRRLLAEQASWEDALAAAD